MQVTIPVKLQLDDTEDDIEHLKKIRMTPMIMFLNNPHLMVGNEGNFGPLLLRHTVFAHQTVLIKISKPTGLKTVWAKISSFLEFFVQKTP